MCMNKGNNHFCCCIFSLIASIVTAIAIAGIFYTGLITSITTLVYFTLVLGILGLLYIIFTVFCGGKHQCNAIKNSCLITTSIGAIVTSAFALSITLAPASITVGILIGAVAFFLISSLLTLVNLIVDSLCNNHCSDSM